MKFLFVTIICNLLSSGHLQQTNNERDDSNLMQPDAGDRNDWPVQMFHATQGNFNNQAYRSVLPRPCSRRSPSEPISQHLSPPLASKVETFSSNEAPLKPQALRNEDNDLQTTNNQVPLPNLRQPKDSDNFYNRKKSLTISNPVIDSTEENHHEIIPTINKEIQEDNPKPLDQMHSAPTSDSLSASSSGVSSQPQSYNKLRFGPNNEYGSETENNYISEPSNAIASEPKGARSMQTIDKGEPFPEFAVEPQTLPPELVAKLLSVSNQVAELSNLNKCSHDKEQDNLIGTSRRSMSSYNDENNAKDILSNDKEVLRNNNNPYIESHIDNEKAMASVLNTEKNILRSNNDQDFKSLDVSNLPTHEKPVSRVGRPQFKEARREMIEPTKGDGIVTMGQSALMLMQSERICYACSTANNPSCWAPDRKTTVKYCRKGNNACLTKTFGNGSTFTLIRDCGRTCDDSETGGIMPKYKTCSICHSELCNSAYSFNGQSIIFSVLLTAVVKYIHLKLTPTFC